MPDEEDTIVVIEDDRNISDLVSMYLRKQGFRVLQADDATGGLDYIARGATEARDRRRRTTWRDGWPRCVQEAQRAEHGPPVVLLTARDDEADRVLGLELGVDDYVTKPFSTASSWLAARSDPQDEAPTRSRSLRCSPSADLSWIQDDARYVPETRWSLSPHAEVPSARGSRIQSWARSAPANSSSMAFGVPTGTATSGP